jgi:hypothetical protein
VVGARAEPRARPLTDEILVAGTVVVDDAHASSAIRVAATASSAHAAAAGRAAIAVF